jgi:hypothetical protein
MSAMKAALLGAIAAVIVVAVVIAIAASGALSTGGNTRAGEDGPVAVGLVLPGSDGTVALRVVDVYTREGSGWSMRSITPSSQVVVSGTGGTSLADAYSFGGGAKLAETLESQLDQPVRAWVIVDDTAWLALRSGSPVPVELPEQVDVFDGKALSSFPAGVGSVAPAQIGLLLDGSTFLRTADGKIVRTQVGDALRSSLETAGPSGLAGVESSLGSAALAGWVKGLGVARRVPGT